MTDCADELLWELQLIFHVAIVVMDDATASHLLKIKPAAIDVRSQN
jgi:hypothetical protein